MSENSTTTDRKGSAIVTLPSDTEILITRVFDAPADLLFEAYTTPELVQRWWGFEGPAWEACDIDLQVGGAWRWVIRLDDGYEVGFHGEYREIERPGRLVFTEAFEGIPEPDANAALVTNTFDEVDGVTTMTSLVQHATKEGRDAHIESGMESGMQISYDRLEEVARSLA